MKWPWLALLAPVALLIIAKLTFCSGTVYRGDPCDKLTIYTLLPGTFIGETFFNLHKSNTFPFPDFGYGFGILMVNIIFYFCLGWLFETKIFKYK